MIQKQILEVQEQIRLACDRSGRNPQDVTLIAVSKTKPVSMLQEAYDCGIREFGENKVQEILQKESCFPTDTHWHMIGHLQTNKVKQVIGKTKLIHSVDSIRLARQIELVAADKGHMVDILLEANVAKEESKYGFFMEELQEAVMQIHEFPHVNMKGFMTIAPFVAEPEDNRMVFRKLYDFYVDIKSKNIDNMTMSVLSMGMSGDYKVAIEEGATMVRIGTGIFGAR